ncbi:MAG: hypothetical protein E7Z99_00780 [Coriobacteriaceae bacterium]|nr:hypothetical protein [Coriobacteriaceae bacterium]
MFAEEQDLATLLEIQQIDLDIMKAKKSRVELPQRIEVMRLRKKREEIREKLEQVMALQKRAEVELTNVEDEDRILAEKQERAQELIDAAGTDFRKVESHSREMAGAAKRREALAAKIEEAKAQVNKIKGVGDQIQAAIAASEAEESKLRASFENEDKALVMQVRDLTERRNGLGSTLPPELLDVYEKTAARIGGVAIGRMVDDRCGVCRSTIEGGRLIELKASAPLGTCPACKRLLVIE